MEQKIKMIVPKYFKARTHKWLVEWFLSLQSHSLHSFFFGETHSLYSTQTIRRSSITTSGQRFSNTLMCYYTFFCVLILSQSASPNPMFGTGAWRLWAPPYLPRGHRGAPCLGYLLNARGNPWSSSLV
jgi:hypothetical protein